MVGFWTSIYTPCGLVGPFNVENTSWDEWAGTDEDDVIVSGKSAIRSPYDDSSSSDSSDSVSSELDAFSSLNPSSFVQVLNSDDFVEVCAVVSEFMDSKCKVQFAYAGNLSIRRWHAMNQNLMETWLKDWHFTSSTLTMVSSAPGVSFDSRSCTKNVCWLIQPWQRCSLCSIAY